MKTQTILGIPFFSGDATHSVGLARRGGLIVAPSGPGLAVELVRCPAYRKAVTEADLVLADSGFMVLIWNSLGLISRREKMERLSGLRFMRLLLDEADVRAPGASLWVMPSKEERDRNLQWLRENGFEGLSEDDCYVAPVYKRPEGRSVEGCVKDEALARVIEARRPRWVFLTVGSGAQEPLGHWLRGRLQGNPAIVCTGAAIAFLTGGQAAIPPWADRLYLGWLLRIIGSPRKFLPVCTECRFVGQPAAVAAPASSDESNRELVKPDQSRFRPDSLLTHDP